MSNVFIINAHHAYPFAEGRLNQSLVGIAKQALVAKGHEVRITTVDKSWELDEELATHQWADFIILQSPINWMGMPWTFKKYMDEVYTAGMAGALCNGDGRSSEDPINNYGAGGTLTGKKYMLSLTFNAPSQAFGNDSEYLFQGKSVDDLLLSMHMNFRFFGMEALPTFACFDVMKNPDIENDFERFKKQINQYF